MVKIKVVGSLTIGDKTFSIHDSEGTIYTKGLGVPDNFYGGYVKEFRATKYGVYLCMNKTGEVVNLAYTDESLTKAGKALFIDKTSEQPEVIEAEPEKIVEPVVHEPETVKFIQELIKKETVVPMKNVKHKGK